MSRAGRRPGQRARPAARFGVRAAASLTALTLTAAITVPAALAPADDPAAGPSRDRTVRGAAGALRAAPTDQIRARQWHLDDMHVQRAWRYSRGSGVTVAVLDTGVDKRHPDLAGRVINGPDLTGGERRPGTKFWGLHGTSMASIIAGHGHGPGQQEGVIGVAPQSQILSVRVTWENDDPMRRTGGDASRNRDAVAQGIRYAVDRGADIINMSLGGGKQFYNGSSTEEDAIRYAVSKGVVLIASAGNDGAGANRKNFPAAYPGVIAVGALDRRLRLWKDSNRHPFVAVCAPGVEIVSADASSGYVVGTGTSPSSAIVAGVAALIRSRYPKLSPDQVRQALVQGSPARRTSTGSSTCKGPLDATRALVAAARLSKTATGPGAAPKSQANSPVTAEPEEGDSKTLLMAIVFGGGLLVLVGLVMGWRQRRRPDDDFDDDLDPLHDPPREPVNSGAFPSAPAVAPVHAPPWQSTDVGGLSGTSAHMSVPHGDRPAADTPPPRGDRPMDVPVWSSKPDPVDPVPSELRPYIAGESGIPSSPTPLNANHTPLNGKHTPFDTTPPSSNGTPLAAPTPNGTPRQPEHWSNTPPTHPSAPDQADGAPAAHDPFGGMPAAPDPLSGPPPASDPFGGPPAAPGSHSGPPAASDPFSGAPGETGQLGSAPAAHDPFSGMPAAPDPLSGPPPASDPLGGAPGETGPFGGAPGAHDPFGGPPVAPDPLSGRSATPGPLGGAPSRPPGPLSGPPAASDPLNSQAGGFDPFSRGAGVSEPSHNDALNVSDPLDVNDPLAGGAPEVGSPLYGAGPKGSREPLNTGGGPGEGTFGTGAFDENMTFDDDEWEKFRRSAMEDPLPGSTTAQPPQPPPPPPVLQPDELASGAFPAAPPPGLADSRQAPDPLDEDPLRAAPRRQRPADEDDYRPPWW